MNDKIETKYSEYNLHYDDVLIANMIISESKPMHLQPRSNLVIIKHKEKNK